MEHEGKSYAGDIIIKQEKTFSVFAKPDIRERLGEFETVMQTRDEGNG